MKKIPSKEFYSNKSGHIQKKNSHLVINTNLHNAFDSRWAEMKIEGKNINSRSNHVCVAYGNSLFVHGGYDVERGILGDFYELNISDDCQEFIWKKLSNICDGKQIKLKSHTGVVFKEKLVLFGGEKATSLSNNTVFIYNFTDKKWRSVPSQTSVPKVDSHCSVIVDQKMLVYGGYISDRAEYLKDIYSFDLVNEKWEIFFNGGKDNEPEGRSNFSIVEHQDKLLIFGGTNGSQTLNDMWLFDTKAKTWKQIQSKDTPQPRRGHSMVKFEDYIFMFGGIENVTKQKNDIYIFSLGKNQWNKIHTTTNSIYDCSPTLKRDEKRNKSPEATNQMRLSPQKSERGMKKILEENKHKKFMQKKKELLSQFNENNLEGKAKKRALSPTTQSMLKTLEAIGNQETTHKELKQQIVYDESHRFIIGKKPCARDGQSVTVVNGKMLIFGGDRHLMAFNDLYQFDLAKGVKSLQFYQH